MGIYLRLYAELFIQDNLTKFLFYFPKIQAIGTLLCCNDNIVTLGEMGFVQSEKFPYEPFDLVSFYCISCRFAYGNPQSRNAQPVPFKNDCKMC